VILCMSIYLRSWDLRLNLGRTHLCSLFLVCGSNPDGRMLLLRRKLPLNRWPSLEIHILGTKRRAQDRPTCSIFEQQVPWTEPQLSHNSPLGQAELVAQEFFEIPASDYTICYVITPPPLKTRQTSFCVCKKLEISVTIYAPSKGSIYNELFPVLQAFRAGIN
jgi:hypothetical protein